VWSNWIAAKEHINTLAVGGCGIWPPGPVAVTVAPLTTSPELPVTLPLMISPVPVVCVVNGSTRVK
jgi:hypothetical protein